MKSMSKSHAKTKSVADLSSKNFNVEASLYNTIIDNLQDQRTQANKSSNKISPVYDDLAARKVMLNAQNFL